MARARCIARAPRHRRLRRRRRRASRHSDGDRRRRHSDGNWHRDRDSDDAAGDRCGNGDQDIDRRRAQLNRHAGGQLDADGLAHRATERHLIPVVDADGDADRLTDQPRSQSHP